MICTVSILHIKREEGLRQLEQSAVIVLSGRRSTAVRSLFCVLFRNERRRARSCLAPSPHQSVAPGPSVALPWSRACPCFCPCAVGGRGHCQASPCVVLAASSRSTLRSRWWLCRHPMPSDTPLPATRPRPLCLPAAPGQGLLWADSPRDPAEGRGGRGRWGQEVREV